MITGTLDWARLDLNDPATFPEGLRLSLSYDSAWTYIHYKGITRAVYPREDGTYSIGSNAQGPVWYDLEVGFTNREDAELRAAKMLVQEFERIGL